MAPAIRPDPFSEPQSQWPRCRWFPEMPSTGPTQGAERHAADTQKWQAHPWLARALSTTILLAPVVAAIVFTWGAGRWFPPERFGIGRWPWMGLVFIAANLILFVFGKLFRRLTPLVGLMRLSLIFPDQAPSRAKATLRSSNSRKLLRQIEEDRAAGKSGEEVLNGDTLVDLLTRLNEHDRLTRGHSERVRAYSELIGTELKLSDDDMNKLRWSALLHDVGKLTVDPEILNKDGRPTDEEWAKLKEHPAAGGHILEPLRPWLGDWIHAADQHHMRWDGNGYPSGLAGNEITLAGRIVAVADAYDVMTSARSYKKPLDPEVARTELTACAGSQFDPDMVRAFLNIGLGRLRAVAGPLAWLSNALGVAQVPVPATTGIATAASTVAGGVATAVVATATGLLPTPAPEPTPPELIAFEEPATPAFSLVAGSVEVSGSEDQAMVVTLSASGATAETVVTMRVGAPALGAVGDVSETTISPEGLASATVEYRPPIDYFGEDGFSYEACDSYDRCSAGSVRLDIEGVNDAPRPRGDRASVAAGQSVVIDVVANDADAEPGDLIVTEAAVPDGTVVIDGNTLVYTPDPETSGEVVISYVVVDAEGLSAAATVVVDVEAAPEPTPTPEPEVPAPLPVPTATPAPAPTPTVPPVATPTPTPEPPPDLAPLAAADQATIDEDTVASVDVLANDRDPEGQPLTITGVSEALNGTAAIVDGRISYQPAADQHGTELLTYTVSDGTSPDVAGSLTIVVNPINDRPVIEPLAFTVAEGTAPGTVLQRVTSSDVDGDALAHQITAGDPTGRFTIDAAGDITLAAPVDRENQASHTLTVTVSDGTLTAAASITVTVSDVDEPPTAGADVGATDEDQQTTIDIGANDADPEGLALTWQVPAVSNAGAALSEVGGVVTYVPKLDHNGVDTFTYVAVDPAGNPTDTTTVTVTVASVNDAPVANDDIGLGFATLEDVPIDTASVVANDTDVDHPVTGSSVELVTQPARGTAVDLGDGRIRYTPNPGVSGTDTFTYRIKDADNTPSAPATVTITVNAVNDDPVLTDPGNQQAAVGLAFSLPASATDPDNDDLTFTASGLPPGFSVDPDTGAITGTPAQGTEGTYGVQLTVTDDGTPTGSDAATFTIEVVTWQLAAASSEVMMTEVLYLGTLNPITEFVEILNAGTTPVDITGWRVTDHNIRVGGSDDLDYTIPATDQTGSPSTLAPGERAVVWVAASQSNLPPLTGLGLEYVVDDTGAKLGNDGDSLWIVDGEGRLVDFMAYKNGGGDTPPPAALGQWNNTHQGDLDVGFSFGLSLALSTDGVDGNTAACWEPTNSEVADDGRCPGVGDTDDNDGIGYLTTSVGRPNDT